MHLDAGVEPLRDRSWSTLRGAGASRRDPTFCLDPRGETVIGDNS